MTGSTKKLLRNFCSQYFHLENGRHMSQWSDFLQGFQTSNSKTDWTKAVVNAEKVVGYTTSYLNLRFLLSDEMSNIAFHLRSLVGSGHPLLKTAKKILSDGKAAMQTRGLTVLLLSKAAGIENQVATEAEKASGLLQSQRLLAEITEMLHTGFIVHRCIVNIPLKIPAGSSDPSKSSKKDMDFGNKLSILTGDYLFANACTSLATLRNPKVVELVSAAIGDYSESEFIGEKFKEGVAVPNPGFSLNDWIAKIEYSSASLLARSCQAALLLSGHSEEQQKMAFEFGRNLAFAWKAKEDIDSFLESKSDPADLETTCLPVVIWLDDNKERLLVPINFNQVVSEAQRGDFPVNRAEEIKNSYLNQSLTYLSHFPTGAAKNALENVVASLR